MQEYPKVKYRLHDGKLESITVKNAEEEKAHKDFPANNPTELGVETQPGAATKAPEVTVHGAVKSAPKKGK